MALQTRAVRLAGLTGAALLAGCQTVSEHYAPLPSQTSDESYRRTILLIASSQTTDGRGPFRWSASPPLDYKLFNHRQKLAICGYYIYWSWSACEYLYVNRWLDAAQLAVNGQPIGDGGFLLRHEVRFESSRPVAREAACAVTKLDWDEAFATASLTYTPAQNVSAQCVLYRGGIQ